MKRLLVVLAALVVGLATLAVAALLVLGLLVGDAFEGEAPAAAPAVEAS